MISSMRQEITHRIWKDSIQEREFVMPGTCSPITFWFSPLLPNTHHHCQLCFISYCFVHTSLWAWLMEQAEKKWTTFWCSGRRCCGSSWWRVYQQSWREMTEAIVLGGASLWACRLNLGEDAGSTSWMQSGAGCIMCRCSWLEKWRGGAGVCTPDSVEMKAK